MIQLEVLSGKRAGLTWSARRFPVRIGRAAAADLKLEDEGVWDEHLRLELGPDRRFMVSTESHGLASLNGQPLERERVPLRNGDLLGLGGIQLRFSLAETRQGSYRLRDTLTWVAIAALCLGQIALIYWFLPGSGE
jgi:hypothetical protein